MHLSNPEFRPKFETLCVVLLLGALWLALHGYHGLAGDGHIYAFQAFARLHPRLTTDLYLQNTSQDQFTVISPMYAWCIAMIGLENAALLLTLAGTLWLLAAAWSFAAAPAGREPAWLAVAFLLIVAGTYGAAGVFRILDPVFTARLPAEALIVTALSCHFRGMKRLGLILAIGSLFIHPLIGLPGLLLIACLQMPLRVDVIVVAGVIVTTLAIALLASGVPAASQFLPLMDAPWLEVVRERSQFLFLQLWTIEDWSNNARPFISLAFASVVVQDERVRKLCAASALVGVAGLAVAFIGGFIAPVAILIQGQAWRWVWITALVGAALVPIAAIHIWRDERGGTLCALLLVSGWVLPGVSGPACELLALIFWLNRAHMSARLAPYFRALAAGLCAGVAVWMIMKMALTSAAPSLVSRGAEYIQRIFALRIPGVLLAMVTWWAIRGTRTAWVPAAMCVLLIALCIGIFPAAFKQPSTADSREFADLAKLIPPTSTVLVAPPRDAGEFVWFTLGRPNYLALDQSSGVVFSRATALEIRRRSDVLQPLMDPEWKIFTRLDNSRRGRKSGATTRVLTSENLTQVCADPQLGFVFSPADVQAEPLRHETAGPWKNWSLYDCRKLRSTPSAT